MRNSVMIKSIKSDMMKTDDNEAGVTRAGWKQVDVYA